MNLSKGEKITEGITYAVEFTKGEEVAEMGEHARKETFSLPSSFSMDNEKMMNAFFEKAKQIMNDKNFDTVVIQKETFEEFIYFKEAE